MKNDFVKCSDCWRKGVRQAGSIIGRGLNACGEERRWKSIGYVCTKGVTTASIIEAITEEISYKWTSNPWSKTDWWIQAAKTCHTQAASTTDNNKSPAMSTYLCENCQKPVMVRKDMLKDELTFKCMSCYQVNHYDLS